MKKFLSFWLYKVFLIILFTGLILPVFAVDDHGLTDMAEKTGLYTSRTDVFLLVGQTINLVLEFLGLITVIIIFVAGFQWMTSGGNSEIIQKAKGKITNAVIGLIIILSALSISIFVTDQIKIATGVEGSRGGRGILQQ